MVCESIRRLPPPSDSLEPDPTPTPASTADGEEEVVAAARVSKSSTPTDLEEGAREEAGRPVVGMITGQLRALAAVEAVRPGTGEGVAA
jgi:hypothetical protein